MRRRSKVIFAVLPFLLVAGSCSLQHKSATKRLPGVWQELPVTIDGNNQEWPAPYPEYDNKAMLGYSVSNDKENIYVTVETGDAATQLKILRGGLTVWIDKSGGKGDDIAINYPLPAYATQAGRKEKETPAATLYWLTEQDRNAPMQKRMADMREKVKKALAEVNEYSLQGFKGCNLQFPIEAENSCGIVVRIDVDKDNELVWEAKIPFKAFYFKQQIDRIDKGKPLSVCFETTGFKNPGGQGQGNGRRQGNMRPGFSIGGMGPMGMRMGGGNMRSNRSNIPEQPDILAPLFISTKTWTKFGIAWK